MFKDGEAPIDDGSSFAASQGDVRRLSDIDIVKSGIDKAFLRSEYKADEQESQRAITLAKEIAVKATLVELQSPEHEEVAKAMRAMHSILIENQIDLAGHQAIVNTIEQILRECFQGQSIDSVIESLPVVIEEKEVLAAERLRQAEERAGERDRVLLHFVEQTMNTNLDDSGGGMEELRDTVLRDKEAVKDDKIARERLTAIRVFLEKRVSESVGNAEVNEDSAALNLIKTTMNDDANRRAVDDGKALLSRVEVLYRGKKVHAALENTEDAIMFADQMSSSKDHKEPSDLIRREEMFLLKDDASDLFALIEAEHADFLKSHPYEGSGY